MNWVTTPATVRRFNWHQVAQHSAATMLWAGLAATAAMSGIWGPSWRNPHAILGLVGGCIFVYHVFFLLAIGARYDVPPDKIAFFPVAWERKRLRGAPGDPDPEPIGKFAPEEKGDYLAILAWSALLVATGVLLRWPGRVGVPGPAAYDGLRAVHAGCGAALSIHILLVHVPGRWLRASAPVRRAVIFGSVPLAAAEARPGWIAELVASGVLVPVPEDTPAEVQRESLQVRDLLERGNRLAQSGLYPDACAAFEEALRLFPDYAQARFNLAVARMREGRADLAAEQFRLFILTDPFNPMAGKAKELLESVVRAQGGDPR